MAGTIILDALSAAVIRHGLAAKGSDPDTFMRSLVAEAVEDDRRFRIMTPTPFRFSTGGNVWRHPGTGNDHPHVQIMHPGDPSRTIRGRPVMCGTLSTPGGDPPKRALDVHWIRVAPTTWLTSTVDFDEPRLLVLLGTDVPDTVMSAAAGLKLSRLADVPAFAGLDPVIERVDRCRHDMVNASTGMSFMTKNDPPALGITLTAQADVAIDI